MRPRNPLSVAFLAAPLFGSCVTTPDKTVVKLFEVWGKDTEATLALLDPEFDLRSPELPSSFSRDDMRDLLEWHHVVEVAWTVEQLGRVDEVTVVAFLTEQDRFRWLLGAPPQRFRATFTVGGKVVREGVFAHIPGEGTTLEDALAPVIEWARATDPAALEGILVEHLPRYDAESAKRWLALLERYRARPVKTEG